MTVLKQAGVQIHPHGRKFGIYKSQVHNNVLIYRF